MLDQVVSVLLRCQPVSPHAFLMWNESCLKKTWEVKHKHMIQASEEPEGFKVCKSVHHQTIQINQPTRCNNFSSFLLDVYLQLNTFRASSRPSSGAQHLQ